MNRFSQISEPSTVPAVVMLWIPLSHLQNGDEHQINHQATLFIEITCTETSNKQTKARWWLWLPLGFGVSVSWDFRVFSFKNEVYVDYLLVFFLIQDSKQRSQLTEWYDRYQKRKTTESFHHCHYCHKKSMISIYFKGWKKCEGGGPP